MNAELTLWLRGICRKAHPLSETMIGILFAVFCLLLLWRGSFLVQQFTLADCIQTVIMLFIAGTMVLGFVAHAHEKRNSASSLNLSSALSLLERAAQVIVIDGKLTNDRVAWVTCARLITRVEMIKNQLSTDVHRSTFEAEHDFQRHKFRDLLRPGGKDLNGAFFCGSLLDESIGQAVMAPSHPSNGSSWIPPRIVRAVYDFISFPDDYEDPLNSPTAYSKKETQRLGHSGYEGVADYLHFRANFFAVGNNIYQKRVAREESIAPEIIDSVVFYEKFGPDDDEP